MEVSLLYRGPLPARRRGTAATKAAIRSHFHPQIRAQFLQQAPEGHEDYWLTEAHGRSYVCLASKMLHTAVRLDIRIFTPGAATQFGDLDNRLKTLVDSLTRPTTPEPQLEHAMVPASDPTYCLMEDDSLLVSLAVDHARNYEQGLAPDETLVVISARIINSPTEHPTWAGMTVTG